MPSLSGGSIGDRAIELVPCYRALAVVLMYVFFGLFQQVVIYAHPESAWSFEGRLQNCRTEIESPRDAPVLP